MTRRSLRDDDRGLAVGIVIFFMIIIIGALLFTLFDPAVSALIDSTSSQAETTGGQDQINLAETVWNRSLYAVAFIGVLFLIGRSVRESERGL